MQGNLEDTSDCTLTVSWTDKMKQGAYFGHLEGLAHVLRKMDATTESHSKIFILEWGKQQIFQPSYPYICGLECKHSDLLISDQALTKVDVPARAFDLRSAPPALPDQGFAQMAAGL